MTRTESAPRLLLVDNYDSYTYNLAHLFAATCGGSLPQVVKGDAYESFAAASDALGTFDAVIISPGPGSPLNPRDVHPLAADALRQFHLPVLGVCLGHQLLCAQHGANVGASSGGPAHGFVEDITLTNTASSALWRGMPRTFRATRYHSLAVDALPECIVPDAWTSDRVLMAVHHSYYPHFGVQFHPESVASEQGERLARNFVAITAKFCHSRPLFDAPSPRPRTPLAIENPSPIRTVVRRVGAKPPDVVFSTIYEHQSPCFWLDSSSARPDAKREKHTPRGRFSIMGDATGPLAEIVTYSVQDAVVRVAHRSVTGSVRQRKERCTIFEYLARQLVRRRATCADVLPIEMNGGYVGYLGYELKNEVAGVHSRRHLSQLPDAWFIFADRVIVVDHENNNVFLIALVSNRGGTAEEDAHLWFDSIERKLARCENDTPASRKTEATQTLRFTLERNKEEYREDIEHCLREIVAGESYEVCLTNRIRTRVDAQNIVDAREIYGALRSVNPAPYSSFLRLASDVAICSSSPERFMRVSSDGAAESKPIKGTRRRDASASRDAELRAELGRSKKDRSENLMIVDLVRNDLARTCAPGSVRVPHLMRVETFASVHQLVSTVRAQLSPHSSCVDCVREAYPMGSMTGAPKARTIDIIDRVEQSARGVYSGSIGYFSICGAVDLSVVIRTAVINGANIEIGVGGAIVALSDPDDEFSEIITKGVPIMKALSIAVTGTSKYELLT